MKKYLIPIIIISLLVNGIGCSLDNDPKNTTILYAIFEYGMMQIITFVLITLLFFIVWKSYSFLYKIILKKAG
jgi:hypothetical protein